MGFKDLKNKPMVTIGLSLLLILKVQAEPDSTKTTKKVVEPAQPCQTAAKTNSEQNTQPTTQKCVDETKSTARGSAKDGEQQALDSVEKKLEEERLKVLFVDVNTVLERVGSTMDWTANWLDGYFAEEESEKNFAKTWGHVTVGWEPRDGEWANFPVKFKVRAKLPNLKNKVELILSDNEQDDFRTLPYESVRPDAYKSSQNSLGAAVRFLHARSENIRASSRLGWGDNQVYARSSITYRKKYADDKVTLTTQPALEYYVSDGWGGRFLIGAGYAFNDRHELRLDYALRDLETFDSPEWRTGLFHIAAIGDKSAVIIGASSVGVVEPEYTPEFHKFSIRFRRKAIRKWIFIEAEPFVEFRRELTPDPITGLEQYSSFERDVGIAFRIEAHYGFL